MTSKNGRTSATPTPSLQTLVKSGLDEAQKGLQTLEAGTQKALQTLTARAESSRKDMEGFLTRLETEHLSGRSFKQLSKRVEQVRATAGKRLAALQSQVVEGVGLASQAQVEELQRELGRLAKKLDAVLGTSATSSKKTTAKVNGEARAS